MGAVEQGVVIYVEVIPHKCQRYPTVGDWQHLPGGLHVSVSDTGDRTSNFLVAIHEIVEAFLCDVNGVSEQDVDEFDMLFEKNREDGCLNEPGDSPKAPYHVQHKVADLVERMVALQAGVNWEKHCERIEALG